MAEVTEVKKLNPQGAAKFILNDIMNDPVKLEAYQRVQKWDENNFLVGNRIFSKVYGTRIEGPLNEINDSFIKKVYAPLNFILTSRSLEDLPTNSRMIEWLGKLAKQYSHIPIWNPDE